MQKALLAELDPKIICLLAGTLLDRRLKTGNKYGLIGLTLSMIALKPKNKTRKIVNRSIDYVHRIVFDRPDPEFMKMFRVSRQLFEDLLLHISPHMNPRDLIEPRKKLAVGLHKLAKSTNAHDSGDIFGCGPATAQQSLLLICELILREYEDKIALPFPESHRRATIKTGFEIQSKLPDVIGAIDSSHIYLAKQPSGVPYPEHFHNRKGDYSVHLQAVVDDCGCFIHIDAGQPGRMHDAQVFRESNLFDSHEEWAQADSYLIGDNGYPLLPWLMVPVKGAQTEEEKYFNRKLSSARSGVERAFGRLKARFKILTPFPLDVTRAPLVIRICCILHNLIEFDHDAEYPEPNINNLDEREFIGDVDARIRDDVEASERRQLLIELINE